MTAFSNGEHLGTEVSCIDDKGVFGWEFQCVEYIRRFYNELGFDTRKENGWWGNAKDYYDSAVDKGLVGFPNGETTVQPEPDDILVFDGQGVGHIAIVSKVSSDRVFLIEQNWGKTGFGEAQLQLTQDPITGNWSLARRGDYFVRGWLRKTGPPTPVQVTFDFVGQPQPWVVPSNVTSVTIDARGAQGGRNPPVGEPEGGKGGRVQTTLAVIPGETLVIYVGGRGGDLTTPNRAGPGGFNGGGAGGTDNVNFDAPAGGGGGASDVRQGGDGLVNRVVVAGGGGGAECCTDGTNGGEGGGTTGMSGGTAGGGSEPGGGGTQSFGGAGGAGCNGSGTSGSLGQGGVGGNGNRAGGGGGGGYYGGGGGGGCLFGSGGGGGSSYPAGTNTIHTPGYQTGAGQVVIAYD